MKSKKRKPAKKRVRARVWYVDILCNDQRDDYTIRIEAVDGTEAGTLAAATIGLSKSVGRVYAARPLRGK